MPTIDELLEVAAQAREDQKEAAKKAAEEVRIPPRALRHTAHRRTAPH
jgi:hypothetical protein